MAVVIRLTRVGRRKSPHYRIVVTDKRFPRDGRFIEVIGHYQPLRAETVLDVEEERALHWLNVGAQPSDTVRSLLRKQGIMEKWHKAREARRKGRPAPEAEAPKAEAAAPSGAEATPSAE